MWASCWPRKTVLAAAAALCVLPALGDAHLAAAKAVRGRATRDTGEVVREIRISERGIHVDIHGDSVIAGGRVHIGPTSIEVDEGGSGVVRIFSDARVEKGKHVEGDVVAVFGSATVDGEVSGDVVSIFGGVKLGPTAVVDGDVVSVGGQVERAPGAQIQGDTVGLGFLPLLTWGLPAIPVIVVTLLAGWALTLFVTWLVTLLFPERFVRIAATASRRTGASFLLGIASGPLVFLAGLLLLITLIGIPLACLLPMLYALTVYVGQIAATYVLGCKLLMRRQRPEEGRNLLGATALGSGFVLLFFLIATFLSATPGAGRMASIFFAAFGGLLLMGLSIIGTGAALLARGGSHPRDLVMGAAGGTGAAQASPPSVASAPSAAPTG